MQHDEWLIEERSRKIGNLCLFLWCVVFFIWLILKGLLILLYESARESHRKYVSEYIEPVPEPSLNKVRIPIPSATRREVLYRSGGCCEECGRGCLHPDIHHSDHDPSNNDVENLVAVCTDCHRSIHKREGYK